MMDKCKFYRVPFGLASDPETHLKNLKIVFQHLLEVSLKLKEIKWSFFNT